MSRIFFSLALFSVVLLVTTMMLGLRIGDYNGPYQRVLELQKKLHALSTDSSRTSALAGEMTPQEIKEEIDRLFEELAPMRQRASTHKLFGILSAIVSVLVNSIAVTYFIGTSRWCKEVTAAYSLDKSYPDRSNQIKRSSFPWSFLGILTTLTIIAFGAASDPATLRANTAQWVQPHLWSAMGGTTIIAVSYMIQMIKIRTHSDLVEEILARVKEIRQSKGLAVE